MNPSSLYRYRSAPERDDDTRFLELLRDRKIFFASPQSFNDPFDCVVTEGMLLVNKQDCQKSFKAAGCHKNERRITRRYQNDMKNPLRRKKFTEQWQEQIRNDFGVLCLSGTNDNIQMWSHYANAHRGFCVEFDIDVLRPCLERENASLHEVRYHASRPIGPVANTEDLLSVLCCKAVEWDYEKEWRFIMAGVKGQKERRVVTFPPKGIRRVILGSRSGEKRRQIISAAREGNPDVKLLQARASDTEFKLEFEEITY